MSIKTTELLSSSDKFLNAFKDGFNFLELKKYRILDRLFEKGNFTEFLESQALKINHCIEELKCQNLNDHEKITSFLGIIDRSLEESQIKRREYGPIKKTTITSSKLNRKVINYWQYSEKPGLFEDTIIQALSKTLSKNGLHIEEKNKIKIEELESKARKSLEPLFIEYKIIYFNPDSHHAAD